MAYIRCKNISNKSDGNECFDLFNHHLQSYRYNSCNLNNGIFTFSINDYANDWSSNVTMYSDTGFVMDNISEITVSMHITEQSGYAKMWIAISPTKYIWGGDTWPTIYNDANVNVYPLGEATGDIIINTSDIEGLYYIYIGATTGKETANSGMCVDSLNGKIVGYIDSVKTKYGYHDNYDDMRAYKAEYKITSDEQYAATRDAYDGPRYFRRTSYGKDVIGASLYYMNGGRGWLQGMCLIGKSSEDVSMNVTGDISQELSWGGLTIYDGFTKFYVSDTGAGFSEYTSASLLPESKLVFIKKSENARTFDDYLKGAKKLLDMARPT